jgi:hypothetical protein
MFEEITNICILFFFLYFTFVFCFEQELKVTGKQYISLLSSWLNPFEEFMLL